MLAEYYFPLILVHVACAVLSGGLFILRGVLRARDAAVANARPVRFLSYGLDSILLTAAILLMGVTHRYPFADTWLTVKVALVALYVVLGIVALKRGRTPGARRAAFYAALTVYVYIIGVAFAHHPLGWFALHGASANSP